MKNIGTPKSLDEAIQNGLEEYGFVNNEKIVKVLIPHIRDFLAQKCIHKEEKIDSSFKMYFEKIFGVLVLCLFLSACESPKSETATVAPKPKQPAITQPTATPTATPSPTPTPSPSPTATPTPTPTPTPSPTPDPLIGVWQNQSIANDVFTFLAPASGGNEQTMCGFHWNSWAMESTYGLTLYGFNRTYSTPGFCVPVNPNPDPYIYVNQYCTVTWINSNQIQMGCFYNGNQYIYNRQ